LAASAFDRIVNFTSVNGHLFWGFHTQSNFIASDFNNNDRDVIVDDDALVLLA